MSHIDHPLFDELRNVRDELAFRTADGRLLRSLYDLESALASMKDNVFLKHVNRHRNDFAAWARDVLKDDYLSSQLMAAHDGRIFFFKKKALFLKAVKKRRHEIESLADIKRKKTGIRKLALRLENRAFFVGNTLMYLGLKVFLHGLRMYSPAVIKHAGSQVKDEASYRKRSEDIVKGNRKIRESLSNLHSLMQEIENRVEQAMHKRG